MTHLNGPQSATVAHMTSCCQKYRQPESFTKSQARALEARQILSSCCRVQNGCIYKYLYMTIYMYVCRFRFRYIQMSDLEFPANLHQKSICNTFIRHFISSLQVIRMSLGPVDQNTPGIADERTMHIDKHNSLKD